MNQGIRQGNALRRGFFPVALVTAVLIAACLFSAGCATQDSDIPWNAPQSWEGSPGIPGLPQD